MGLEMSAARKSRMHIASALDSAETAPVRGKKLHALRNIQRSPQCSKNSHERCKKSCWVLPIGGSSGTSMTKHG